jgi:hypothetical protein
VAGYGKLFALARRLEKQRESFTRDIHICLTPCASAARPGEAAVYFDEGLHPALRVKAAETEQSISGFVNGPVRQNLPEDPEDLAATCTAGPLIRPVGLTPCASVAGPGRQMPALCYSLAA